MSRHQQIFVKWEKQFLENEIVLWLQVILYSPPIVFLQTPRSTAPNFHGSAYADSPYIASTHHRHSLWSF